MPSPTADLPADLPASHALLRALLDVSLTGIILFQPVYAAEGTGDLIDWAYAQLNPAAQRMLRLPAHPPQTFLTLYPNAREAGIFAFYRDTFLSGQPGEYQVNYSFDGLDNYFLLAAQRSGELLLVSFSDTAEQDRSAVEHALRESQAREQAARADADTQRQRLYRVLMNLPAQVATYHGPEHVYAFVNPRYQDYFPTRALLGRAVREVMPQVAGQGFFERLDQVYATGEPVYGQELPVQLDFAGTGHPPELVYINASYLPLRDAAGRVDGVLDFSYDVTEQVRARQQVEQLNRELEARVQRRTAQLRHHQGLLTQILRQVPAAIATLRGPEHRYTFFNDAYHALSGGRPRLERPVAEVLPELVAQGFTDRLDRVYATGQPFIGPETPVQLLDAATGRPAPRFVDVVYQPLTDEQGQSDGILAFVVDVTEKVQARQQVDALQQQVLAAAQRQAAERESLYRVFAQTPAVVALLRDSGHRFEYVNPAYQALFPGRPLVGRTVAEAAPELVAQGFGALLDGVYRSGETYFGQELPFTPPPAPGQAPRPAYYNFTYQAYRENGAVAGVSIFAYDVTEQVLARQAREAERQLLTDVFAQAPAGIWVVRSPDYVFEVINPAMTHILGRTAAQALGRPYFEVLPELASQGLPALLGRVWEQGKSVFVEEFAAHLAYHAPGEVGYFTFVFQPLRDAHGLVARISCVALDVTSQVRARQQEQALNEKMAAINEELAATNEELAATNEELLQANTQLTRTNVDLDNFIYTASHDLKVPIANIEGLRQALVRELPPAALVGDVPTMLRLMQESTERFGRTIEHLTDVSKLQQAHRQPTTHVGLAAVVADIRLDLLPLVQHTRARLTVDVPPAATVPFSEKNLRSVVYNLLSNALKYRHPDRAPAVQLTYFRQDHWHVLRVQDNGLGFDVGQAEGKLFGMFQRLHTHVEGTGIGLYMVKKMVENSGGRIDVTSHVGVGTTFTVFIPVHQET